MDPYKINEQDWELFKIKIKIWQENYIGDLIKKYNGQLNKSAFPSEKFWKLEKQINTDKNKTGVIIKNLSRTSIIENIISLINEKVISYIDLLDFSSELKSYINEILDNERFFMGNRNKIKKDRNNSKTGVDKTAQNKLTEMMNSKDLEEFEDLYFETMTSDDANLCRMNFQALYNEFVRLKCIEYCSNNSLPKDFADKMFYAYLNYDIDLEL